VPAHPTSGTAIEFQFLSLFVAVSFLKVRVRARPRKEASVQAKDKKKFDELAQKLPELEKNLGPEYLGLGESLGKANLPPKDGQEIVSMFDKLDDSCPH
jgi:hypothetical protein